MVKPVVDTSQAIGVELTIAALLGHSARGVTQRYIHIDEALRLAADKIAGEIADLLEGRGLIPDFSDQDLWAQSRNPSDMMVQG